MINEVEGNCKTPDQETMNYRLNHTMLRVKDPVKSVDFYTRVMGMKLLRKIDFPAAKFSLYFLGSFDEHETKDKFFIKLQNNLNKIYLRLKKANDK